MGRGPSAKKVSSGFPINVTYKRDFNFEGRMLPRFATQPVALDRADDTDCYGFSSHTEITREVEPFAPGGSGRKDGDAVANPWCVDPG